MKHFIFLLLAILCVKENIVYGYLDPSTGGGILAFIVAIAVCIAFYSKKIFYGIKNIFVKKDKKEE